MLPSGGDSSVRALTSLDEVQPMTVQAVTRSVCRLHGWRLSMVWLRSLWSLYMSRVLWYRWYMSITPAATNSNDNKFIVHKNHGNTICKRRHSGYIYVYNKFKYNYKL